MSEVMSDPDDQIHTMAEILANSATAMSAIKELVYDIELQFLDRPSRVNIGIPTQPKLQNLDLLSQSIQEVEMLLKRLSTLQLQSIIIQNRDIIAPIRLEYLRNIIRDGAKSIHQLAHNKNGSDISLF